ncbi:MAG: UDP-2,4-diacetamido-2,4,6-trideoxy-beta-L-altropyranose hydrolase [Fibrobacterota bacterium]|nr:UDP-2,4-diacetamido-2,4,6-trideoxy-beta-L-altropyranose hydrolase [Fibrobacterota bacterium]
MRILFRTDASLQIGTGHVMRCLTLAETLRDEGDEVVFLCREHAGHLKGRIESRGFPVHMLAPGAPQPASPDPVIPAHAPWLGATWREDADATEAILARYRDEGRPVNGMVIDHYALDARWESRVRDRVDWIAVIDDLADRPHASDLLLDQNLYAGAESRYLGLTVPECLLLLGPAHALLRREFAETRASLRRELGRLRRLLVFFGGTDPGNDTLKAVAALDLIRMEGLFTDIVVGEANPYRTAIEAACAGRPGIRLHIQAERMSALMAEADLAIGAGGTTSWERCCLGLPCLTVSVAENQMELVLNLDRAGAVQGLGRSSEVTPEFIATAVEALAGDPGRLSSMSRIAAAMVDGDGSRRVAEAIRALPVRTGSTNDSSTRGKLDLRRAREGDLRLYFDWANEEETRRNSYQTGEIDMETHSSWFLSRLIDPETCMYILEIDGVPAGQIRFQFRDGAAEIGFSVATGFRGGGLAAIILKTGITRLQRDHPGGYRIRGLVMKGNTASAKAFVKAGFPPARETVHQGVESFLFIQESSESP